MKPTRSCVLLLLVGATLVMMLAPGCSRKKSQAALPAEVETNTATAAAAAPAAPQAAPAPRKLDFAPVQSSVQARDYEKAAEQMIVLQRSVKDPTPDQSMALVNQMHALSRTLAGAAASGDPKAKAAIQKLTAGMSGQ